MTFNLSVDRCMETNWRFSSIEGSEGICDEDHADYRKYYRSSVTLVQFYSQQQQIWTLVKRSLMNIRQSRAVAKGSIHLILVNSDKVR